MTGQLFIEQQIQLGETLHEHRGVWWQRQGPFYWKPAIPYQCIRPGQAKPSLMRALVGYSHAVDEGMPHNRTWSLMALPERTPGRRR